jgi:hypothetical protein
MTGAHYHTQLFIGWDLVLLTFFIWASLQPRPSRSLSSE